MQKNPPASEPATELPARLGAPASRAASGLHKARRPAVTFEADPQDEVARHNLASRLVERSRYFEALALLRPANASRVLRPESAVVLARALIGAGALAEAETTLVSALTQAPRLLQAHLALAELRWMATGDLASASAALRQAVRRHPSDPALLLGLAKVLGAAGDHGEACELAFDALMLVPGDGGVRLAAAQHALACGDASTAFILAETVYAERPDDRRSLESFCMAALALGRAERAYAAAGSALRADPDDQLAKALLAVAARVSGLADYARLHDYDALVASDLLETPPGWSSLRGFLDDLKATLEARHRFRHSPYDQSVRGGGQIELEVDSADPVLGAFFASIRPRLEAYVHGSALRSGVLGSASPEIAGAWSVRLRSGGHHASHIHPRGRISSAFYVDVPPTGFGEDRRGWLYFGKPGFPVHPPLEADHHIRPEPGLLVLFPSYMFHGTIPFEAAEHRLSLAFDVRGG